LAARKEMLAGTLLMVATGFRISREAVLAVGLFRAVAALDGE
jgi:hypothetical protein